MMSEIDFALIHRKVQIWEQDQRRKQEYPTSEPIVTCGMDPRVLKIAAKEMGIDPHDLEEWIEMETTDIYPDFADIVIGDDEPESKPPRPKPPIQPYQNSCFCVQCGVEVKRGEGESVYMFGKRFRCDTCHSQGVKLGDSRFCRTCGEPFLAIGRDNNARRQCEGCVSKRFKPLSRRVRHSTI